MMSMMESRLELLVLKVRYAIPFHLALAMTFPLNHNVAVLSVGSLILKLFCFQFQVVGDADSSLPKLLDELGE